jgi:hypothetical protein
LTLASLRSTARVRSFELLEYQVEMLRLLVDRMAVRQAILERRAAALASNNTAIIALAERTAERHLRPSSPLPAANDQFVQ